MKLKTKNKEKKVLKAKKALDELKQKYKKTKVRDRMVSTKIDTQARHLRQRVNAMVKKPRKVKNLQHYVDPKELHDKIRTFYKSGSAEINDDELALMITKIAHRLAFAPNFINYSYREEMCGDAIVKMLSALKNKKFKINQGYNPFSYFTKIAFNSFCSRIKKEKKNHETLEAYQKEVYDNLMTRGHVSSKAHENNLESDF